MKCCDLSNFSLSAMICCDWLHLLVLPFGGLTRSIVESRGFAFPRPHLTTGICPLASEGPEKNPMVFQGCQTPRLISKPFPPHPGTRQQMARTKKNKIHLKKPLKLSRNKT